MAKKINGILCNDAGQPITMNNGYSSEDVEELYDRENSSFDYTEAKTNFENDNEDLEKQPEDDGYEYIDGIRFKDGYLCDDNGLPINIENGYSSEDENFSTNFYNEHKCRSYQSEDDSFERE